jgi:phage gp36-like protein
MSYATQSDLEARLAPEVLLALADDDGDETADAAVVEAALAGASAQIDQALAARYVTPLAGPPEIVKRWCLDLAVATLFLRKKAQMTAEHAQQADLTRRALAAIANGLTGLAGAEPRLDAFESDNTRLADEAAFTRESLEPY